jgi:hypothetical protein
LKAALIRLAGEGRSKSNSCLSLLARSVPPCGPEVDDVNGLYFVRELIANMATIPKLVVPACDWRENDPLLTPQQVAERLKTSLDWVWDHSSRKMPLLPVIRFADGPGRAGMLRYRASKIEEFIEEQERRSANSLHRHSGRKITKPTCSPQKMRDEMGKSHQRGWVVLRGKKWYGYHRRTVLDPTNNEERVETLTVILGQKSQMTKFQARERLELEIAKQNGQNPGGPVMNDGAVMFGWFVRNRFLFPERGELETGNCQGEKVAHSEGI